MTESRRSEHRRIVAEWALLATTTLLVGALIAWLMYADHREIEARERGELQREAKLIEDNLIRQLHGLRHVFDWIRSEAPRAADAAGRARLSAQLQQLGDAMPGVATIAVLDADGTIVAASRAPLVGRNFRERDYFVAPRSGVNASLLYISPPYRTVFDELALNVSRVIVDSGGAFAGVVTASLDADHFNALLGSVLHARDMRAMLVHGDGRVFLFRPDNAGMIGRDLAQFESFFTRHRASGELATATSGTSRGFGDRWMTATRTVAGDGLAMDKPLVVAASREMEAVFGAWHRQLQLHVLGWVVLTAAAAVALRVRQWRRLQRRLRGKARERERQLVAERMELALGGANIGLWDWHVPSGKVVFDARWCAMLGYQPAEIPAELASLQDRVHHADRPALDAALAHHLAGAADRCESEHRLRHRDGRWIWVLGRGKVIERDSAGAPLRFVGTCMEVTDLRSAADALRASEERYRAIVDSIDDAVVTADSAGGIVGWNPGAEAMFGRRAEEVIGSPLDALMPEGARAAHAAAWAKVSAGGEAAATGQGVELTGLRSDGSEFPLELSLARWIAAEGWFVTALIRDTTERKLVDADLRVAATAFDAQQEGMLVTDARNVIVRVNRAFCEATGYSAAEAIGQTPRLLRSGRHEPAFYGALWLSLLRHGRWQGEIWNRHKSGELFLSRVTISVVKGVDGGVSHYIGTLIDITHRRTAEAQINQLAYYDRLTQLPNRQLLRDRLQHALAGSARRARPGALLLVDLDDFRTINEVEGHDAGDLLLMQVAQRLVSQVRAEDTVARLGGDEFVVLLEDLSTQSGEAAREAEAIAAKVLSVLAQPYALAGRAQHCTASIGVALFFDHLEGVDDIVERAEMAMYRAKAGGRNGACLFDPEMQAAVAARAALETDLHDALREQQFLLFYQPQVDVDGRWIGMEALVRWKHPRRGLVPPIEFIPVAEETGLIVPLGRWVLETACRQLVSWSSDPRYAGLVLAVNVSACELHRRDFVTDVRAALARTGAPATRLVLEFTESMLLHDVKGTVVKMTALKMDGVRFAVDDFGTGYSSLAYLKDLPLDQLKIDRSFVHDAPVDASVAAIARSIIGLGQSLGLEVLAEGVETPTEHAFLARLGCGAFQGYLFGRPAPAGVVFDSPSASGDGAASSTERQASPRGSQPCLVG